jgi:hypothetical protein
LQIVYATRPKPTGGEGGYGATEASAANVPQPTTTIHQTSTITKVITIYPNSSGSPETGMGGYPTGGAGASSPVVTGEACAPETVTVTEKETVYVTATPASPETSNAPVGSETPSYHSVIPIQSSSGAYYPSAAGSSPVYNSGSTGFMTVTYTSAPSASTIASAAELSTTTSEAATSTDVVTSVIYVTPSPVGYGKQ